MKKLLTLLLILFPLFIHAQSGIKGTVLSKDGEKLGFATLFIKELSNGTSTNQEGVFVMPVPSGSYTLLVQYLGYQTLEKKIEVKEDYLELNLRLEPQSILLEEVVVEKRNEDPAYTIMRKAIAKSEYHQKQVLSYKAKVYIKGSGQILNIPKFIKKQIEKDENSEFQEVFLSESLSELSFEAPNKYSQKVLSMKSNGNDNNSSPIGFITTSLYQSEVNGVVSPFSPKAFSYYRFVFEGSFYDQGREVNKILVKPISRGEDVFEGHIYIIEDLWCLHSAELNAQKMGFKFQFSETLSEIKPTVWLPTGYTFLVKGGIMGIDIEYSYFTSLSNYTIEVNPDLIQDVKIVDEKVVKIAKEKKPESPEEIEKLLSSGEEVRRKDFLKYMKEQKKKEEEAELKAYKEKKQAEKQRSTVENTSKALGDTVFVKDTEKEYYTKIEVDSNATKASEESWNQWRPIPLTTLELESYKKADSIKSLPKKDTISVADSTKKKKSKSPLNYVFDPLVGATYTLSKTSTLSFMPLLRDLSFNAVEGLVLSTGIDYSKRFIAKDSTVYVYTDGRIYKKAKEVFTLNLIPQLRYSTAREVFNGKMTIKGTYNTKNSKKNEIEVSFGRYISQYNDLNPIPTIVNTFYAYALGKNYIKVYERDFLRVASSQQIGKSFKSSLYFEGADRKFLDNASKSSLFNKDSTDFSPNKLSSNTIDSLAFTDHRAMILGVRLSWTPKLLRSSDRHSSYPEFTLEYRKGLKGIASSNVDFDFVQIGMKHEFELGIHRFFGFSLGTGGFLNAKSLYFPDYTHFLGNQTLLQTHDKYASFRILDYYSHSTSSAFARAHAHYQFRSLLFTQLATFRYMGWNERLFANYLTTKDGGHYTELGYGIDHIFRIFSLEGIVSFQDTKYQSWGVRVGISLGGGIIFN